MKISKFQQHQAQDAISLFHTVFSASDGEQEGKAVSGIVSNMLAAENEDIIGFTANGDDGVLIGCIFFSKLSFPNEPETKAYILSPVAVSTNHQGQGIGQKLISFGLEALKAQGVDFVTTYGDPKFYSKVGFQQIAEEVIKAPFTLSFPVGWQACPLSGDAVTPMSKAPVCVEALSKPEYW